MAYAAPAWLLVGLLLLPGALAGSEAAPEVVDARDQGKATIDLLAAWLENERDGVRVTFKLATVEETPATLTYALGFTINSGSRRVATIAFDAEGGTHTIVERVGYGPDYPGLDTYPDTVRDVEVRPGSPGTISGLVPWGASPGFQPGATMSVLYALTDDGRTGDGRDYVDLGDSNARFLLDQPPLPVGTIAGWSLAAMLAFAGVAAVGVTVWRRRRPAPPAAPTEAGDEGEPSRTPEAGARFQLDPRGRP